MKNFAFISRRHATFPPNISWARRVVALFTILVMSGTACSRTATEPSSVVSAPTEAVAQAATNAVDDPHAELNKKPLQTYTAKFLDGSAFNSDDLPGMKIIFAFFSYKNKEALPMLTALQKIQDLQNEYRFQIYGVSIDYNAPDDVKSFLTANKITFPTLLENSGLELATKLGIENEVALVGLNNGHQPAFGIRQYVFASMENGEQQFIDYMKQNLAVRSYRSTNPILGIRPKAPDFASKTLDGKDLKLSDYRGKAVLLLFFSPKCPHCQAEIKFLREKLYPELHPKGLEVIAISVFELTGDMLELAKSFNMPWPLIDDHSRTIRGAYSGELGVPENFFIDKEGLIRFTTVGYSEAAEDLQLMRARALLGVENPILLSDKRFNGAESCMVCHEAQYASWQASPHAHAFETLLVKGEEGNKDCVGCHTIGMNDPHGWQLFNDPKTGKQVARVPEVFQNVQCEHCHGIGGPHKSKPRTAADMEQSCLKCHTDKFSLHFDFHERVAKVNHSDAQKILKMTDSQRLELLKKVSKRPEDLFGSEAKYVGSDSCMSCHADTHKNWASSVHGKGEKKDFSQPGVMQELIRKEGVGASCESCHGPGEKHVQSKLKADIRGLGDDCPFCVIEQICLSCHTPQNDPNFNIARDLAKIKGHK